MLFLNGDQNNYIEESFKQKKEKIVSDRFYQLTSGTKKMCFDSAQLYEIDVTCSFFSPKIICFTDIAYFGCYCFFNPWMSKVAWAVYKHA